jgi:DNA-directed RNA polymerase alpha subunit
MSKPIISKEAAVAERDEAIRLAHQKFACRLKELDELAERYSKKPSTLERAQIAWELRQTGLTLRAVGEHLGVKAERASQLIEKHERILRWRERHPDGVPDGPRLSVRAANALRYAGLDEDHPEEVAKWTAKELLNIPNMGRVSLRDIAVWLDAKGLSLAD